MLRRMVCMHDSTVGMLAVQYLKGPLIGNLTWYCGDEDYGIGEPSRG